MRRFVVLGAAALFTFVLAAADASAATLYTQSNVLRGPEIGACGGISKGSCKVSETGAVGTSPVASGDIKIQCNFKGAASGTYTVFWTGSDGSRSCHGTANGFITLGTIFVPATGKAKFTDTIGNNPFPPSASDTGHFHIDMTGPASLTAVFAGVPIGVGPVVGTQSVQPGDPTAQ